ncbi:MAG: helix-turn-helix domain-containing protein [Oscillibacter sp.]|nr:helix-turn-helix domain-containing protein [Oscillibacter sp.]
MTIGQRVAQKRKERGLSQEALGETLGVSRQSVYKWESDSALPEIDKLIALSKLFNVTVGWLLGVEEPASPGENREKTARPDGSENEPGELTETQLKMVEEIVDRYLAAQPSPKKRRWPWIAGAAAVLVLLWGFCSLQSQLRNDRFNMQSQYNNLQNTINNVTRSVDGQIEGITNRVEEVLKNQNNLTADYGTELISADLPANTVTFRAHATPKTYTEGMTALFVVDNGEEPAEVPGNLDGSQTFSAGLTCGLTDSINISVVFITGDVRETQLLETHYGLYGNSLPDAAWPESDFSMTWKELNAEGELKWSSAEDYAYLANVSAADSVNALIGRAEVKSLRVGLFRNHALLGWLEPCDRPDSYGSSYRNSHFYRFPDISVVPTETDEFRLCTVVVDEFGREFVYRGIPCVLDAERGELTMAKSGEIGRDDPDDWEY